MLLWLAALGFALPSARLTPHKPALSMWANWLYLSSLLRLCIVQGVICCRCCFAYLFGGRGFVFLFCLPLKGLCNCHLRHQLQLSSAFGYCPSSGIAQPWGEGACMRGHTAVRKGLGAPQGWALGFHNQGCWEVCCHKGLPAEAELHKLLDNLC